MHTHAGCSQRLWRCGGVSLIHSWMSAVGTNQAKVILMKTMEKLQIAAAAASLFAASGVATAANLNSSGATIAAETVFPTTPLGNDTKVKAPAFSYAYEGGVNAQSRQTFKIATNLVGADWVMTSNPRRLTDPSVLTSITAGASQNLARTISAEATVNGVGGRFAVIPGTDPDPAAGFVAIKLLRVEAGNTIAGAPAQFATNGESVVTYVFELVNNSAQASVDLRFLTLTFSSFKAAGGMMHPLSAPDSATTSLADYPPIYSLANYTVNTNVNPCANPNGAVKLQAISGNNHPAVLSQEDTVGNGGNFREVGNYLLFARGTAVTLTKSGDRLVQVTNSFGKTSGTTPVNGIGGIGGGRYTFKPSREVQAIIYGGNQNGWINEDDDLNGPNNASMNAKATFPERGTTGDELGAKLGVLNFSNLGNALDRLLDLDIYSFKPEVGPLPPAQSFAPSAAPQYGDFSVGVAPVIPTDGNLMGGVDVSGAPITATPLSGALVIQFVAPGGFATANALSLHRGGAAFNCATAGPGLSGNLLNAGNGQYYWRFTRADLQAESGTNTLLGDWSVCYRVNGETPIPATAINNVMVTLLKDDVTEQPLKSCTAELASIYGGVTVDVRNFLMHQAVAGTAEDKKWRGILRIINNSERDEMHVEAQYIHEDGKYGMWGPLGTWAPRAARYVVDTAVQAALTIPVTNPTAEVNNAMPTTQTVRLRVEGTGGTIRVQNYAFNLDTKALTEISSTQGADFMNIGSSNRDHIDQDAQFNIVKDGGTLTQRLGTVPKAAITNANRNTGPFPAVP
ncbi:hypothetical protein [Piscinibacter sakaiensis]|uniref:hypothetical protein n=1 Tax=Piscinibacter sakaiensis TaxID=1547922 RepID=UPI003AABE01C